MRWEFTDPACTGVMLPGIFQSAKKESETAAAMGEADAQLGRQLIECPAQDHCDNTKLCFGGHADSPRHHVFRHPKLAQHVPGMHQHRRAFVGTVMKEGDDAGIVKILFPDMIADLHAEMTRAHAAGE